MNRCVALMAVLGVMVMTSCAARTKVLAATSQQIPAKPATALKPTGNGLAPMFFPLDAKGTEQRTIERQELAAHLGITDDRRMIWFPLGQIGVLANKDGVICGIQKTQPSNGLKLYDRITEINGVAGGPTNQDWNPTFAKAFGRELDKAEAKDSILKLKVERVERGGQNPKIHSIHIALKSRGSFGPKPHLSKKAEAMNAAAASSFLNIRKEDGWYLPAYGDYFCSLGLLASEHEDGLEFLEPVLDYIEEKGPGSTYYIHYNGLKYTVWHTSMAAIFTAEYYWMTGDERAFRLTERLTDYLTGFVSADGGVGHRRLRGYYGADSFGPGSGIWLVAMTTAAKAGVAVDINDMEKVFEFYERDAADSAFDKYNSVTYSGRLTYNGSQAAFRTACYAIAATLHDIKPEMRKRMMEFLVEGIPGYQSTHASPSHGEYFASLALGLYGRTKPEVITALTTYKAPVMTLSWDADDHVHHIHDYHKGGGADGNMGSRLGAARNLVFLNLHKHNLIITGTKQPLAWRSKSKNNIDRETYHKTRIASILKSEYQYALDNNDLMRAHDWLEFISDRYLHKKQQAISPALMREVAKQVASLRKELQSHPQWQAASTDIEDRAALRYLAMRMMNKPRPQRIETFIERFGDTRLGQSIAKDRAKEVAAIKASGKHEEGKPVDVDAAKITKPYDLEERFLETEPPLLFDPHRLYDKTRKPISAQRIEDIPYTEIIDRINRRMGIERKNFRKSLFPSLGALKNENASAEQKAKADRHIQDTIKDIFARLAAAKEAVKKAKPIADAAKKEALAATQVYQASKKAFEQANQELADKADSPEASKELAAKKAAYEKAGDALSKAERSSVVAGRELGLREHDVRVLENRVLILKEYKLIE